MTAAGLRSLFRHHRMVSKVPQANPHRFRHSFGSDMVRAGISLPALMHLMGHADIHTTMLYVPTCPRNVWCEFARAVQQLVRFVPSGEVVMKRSQLTMDEILEGRSRCSPLPGGLKLCVLPLLCP